MKVQDRMVPRWIVVCSVAALVAAGVIAQSAGAYPRYNDGCQQCHGAFTGPDSPRGTVFPEGNKHEMHRGNAYMNTECDLCHTSGDNRNPFLGSSNGTGNNPGVGCTGCHGRDYGGDLGDSGVGLRLHHINNNFTICEGCHHGDTDPEPLPENIKPTYYGTVDTDADDPCNEPPDNLENWSINNPEGLDNDGDGVLYDGDDPACAPPCPQDLDGSGAVDFGDILAILANWGPCGGECPQDLDGSGAVDFGDILAVLANWGPCP